MTDDENKMMAEVINLLLFAPLEFSLLFFPPRSTTSEIKIEEQLNRNPTSSMVTASFHDQRQWQQHQSHFYQHPSHLRRHSATA